eukprot:TRINITY_DN10283_c0_g1_i1.p1 TRINITY_DN10283_c0_g1~~TRINITY_DN10283_c0_g1_i1.p1  ORF type:complete len:243 (+),score=50.06 TRINITY_DN10283_c0_g1_i1:71-730(+)
MKGLKTASYDSDLVYLKNVYDYWYKSGKNLEGKTCLNCQKRAFYYNEEIVCRKCRVKHANEESLNNKVLECISQNVRQVEKNILKFSKVNKNVKTNEKEENIMGRCLYHSYPEQVGELLINEQPQAGIKLLSKDVRGKISPNSAILQKSDSKTSYYLALSITILPSGFHIVDKLHPLEESNLKGIKKEKEGSMKKLFSENIGPKVFEGLEVWQQEKLGY